MELFRMTKDQAAKIFKKFAYEQVLTPHGIKRGTYYTAGPKI